MTEELKFEKAMERLEKIVEDLESGNLSLEDALKRYEEGVRLSRACQKKLDESEKKIEILTRSLDGSLKPEPFDLSDKDAADGKATAAATAEAEAKIKKVRKTVIQETVTNEEDLLF